MGNGAIGSPSNIKLPQLIERRPPLTNAAAVLGSVEGKERIVALVKFHSPGVASRWEKILAGINREIEPTKEIPDPLRINIDLPDVKSVLGTLFHDVKYISSDGLALAREWMPKLYDKHNTDRNRKASIKEREERKIADECFAYGELDHEIFATMFMKIISVYGAREGGIFYDLGCGVGTLVGCSLDTAHLCC
jgi:hypothetical protein